MTFSCRKICLFNFLSLPQVWVTSDQKRGNQVVAWLPPVASPLSSPACQVLTRGPVKVFCNLPPACLYTEAPAALPVNWHQLQVAAFASLGHGKRCLCHCCFATVLPANLYVMTSILFRGELCIKTPTQSIRINQSHFVAVVSYSQMSFVWKHWLHCVKVIHFQRVPAHTKRMLSFCWQF